MKDFWDWLGTQLDSITLMVAEHGLSDEEIVSRLRNRWDTHVKDFYDA